MSPARRAMLLMADRHTGRIEIGCLMAECAGASPCTGSNRKRIEGGRMTVKFSLNDHGNPPGKLADAELHFTEGALDGLKLIGFGVWQRRTGSGRNVTFPARQYSINGERRSFALLRAIVEPGCQDRLRDLILAAYAEYEQQQSESNEVTGA